MTKLEPKDITKYYISNWIDLTEDRGVKILLRSILFLTEGDRGIYWVPQTRFEDVQHDPIGWINDAKADFVNYLNLYPEVSYVSDTEKYTELNGYKFVSETVSQPPHET